MTRRGSGITTVWALVGMLLGAGVASAQSNEVGQGFRPRKNVVSASTGLVGFGAGKLVRLTLVDVAERAAPRGAVLRILDSENEVLAETKGDVAPGQPLTLELRREDVPRSDRLQIRGTAKFARQGRWRNVFNFTVEVIDPDEEDCECQVHCPALCENCFPPPGQRGEFMKGDCSITFGDSFATP